MAPQDTTNNEGGTLAKSLTFQGRWITRAVYGDNHRYFRRNGVAVIIELRESIYYEIVAIEALFPCNFRSGIQKLHLLVNRSLPKKKNIYDTPGLVFKNQLSNK